VSINCYLAYLWDESFEIRGVELEWESRRNLRMGPVRQKTLMPVPKLCYMLYEHTHSLVVCGQVSVCMGGPGELGNGAALMLISSNSGTAT